MAKIARINIDVLNRTIECYGADDNPIPMALTASGSSLQRYARVSAGGHIIQALVVMLDKGEKIT